MGGAKKKLRGKVSARGAAAGAPARGSAPSDAAAPPGRLRREETLVVASPDGGELRADRYIAEVWGLLGRSQQKARGARIYVNGREVKPSRLLSSGERLALEWTEEPPPGLVPEDLPLAVIFEDERCLVVDKAQGMVTHPGHGNRRGTLANAVLGRLAAGGSARPPERAPERGGIVHRLDKDTSGLIIVAKDAEAQAFLASQFKDRTTRKEYLAVLRGVPNPPEGRIEDRLGRDRRDRKRFARVAEGGKPALTEYRVIARYGAYSLVSLRPKTGRTHQLRVHMAGLGTPILGDPIYGKPDPAFPAATLMLHAYRLRIRLPGRDEPSLFRAAPPRRFRLLLAELERRAPRA